ncbi:PhoH family protein [Escherichia coli]
MRLKNASTGAKCGERAEYGKAVNIKTKRGVIKPRTPNQAQYIANILDHDITFGVGPAGTGKTYLAVAAAVDALERQEIRRILLTVRRSKPVRTGLPAWRFKPESNPYLRPLYDALFEMLGFEKVEKLIERNVIESRAAGLYAWSYAERRVYHSR